MERGEFGQPTLSRTRGRERMSFGLARVHATSPLAPLPRGEGNARLSTDAVWMGESPRGRECIYFAPRNALANFRIELAISSASFASSAVGESPG